MKARIKSLEKEIMECMYQFEQELKTHKPITRSHYDRMDAAMNKLLILHKAEPSADKTFLSELYMFPYSLRNEMAYSNEREFLEQASNKFEIYFGLLLAKEAPGDRVPGVPRIF